MRNDILFRSLTNHPLASSLSLNHCHEDYHFLRNNYFAYRRHRSTNSCFNQLFYTSPSRADIKSLFSAYALMGGYVLLVERDIRYRAELPSDIIPWMWKIICKRKLVLCGHQVSINNGLIQRCVLSPVLFNIYTSALHEKRSNKVEIFQYADDSLIVVTGDFTEAECLFINQCSRFKQAVNLKKFWTIVFSRVHADVFRPNINSVFLE